MPQIKKTMRKVIKSCKLRGLLGFIKSALTYISNKYQPSDRIKNLSRHSGKRRKIKIFYVDHFTPENSNFYWLKAFRKFGRVKIFDIVKDNLKFFEENVLKFEPDHIHLGGSVKNDLISSQILGKMKRKLNCTISAFYGDGLYSSYHFKLAKVVDYVYLSNKTHIKKNWEKGLENFKYMLCPTDSDIFSYQERRKLYDLVFIGNNNQSMRLSTLKKIAKIYNLKVFGNGWQGTELNCGGLVYGKDFSRVCNQSKICLGVMETNWSKLEACFSNRLVNTLATGSFYVSSYSPGLENIFTNKKHLVWYKNQKELVNLIDYYLKHPEERERIAKEGQKEVYTKYTYEKSVERILKDAGRI